MRISLLGPTYPYRGGIAQHTTLLARQLRREGDEVQFLSYTRQYPRLLYGRDDKDPTQTAPSEPADYVLDSLNPLTWIATANRIVAFAPDLVIIPWWVSFWAIHVFVITRLIKWRRPQTTLIFLCHNVLPHEAKWFDPVLVNLALARGDWFVVHARSEIDKLRHFAAAEQIVFTPMPLFNGVEPAGTGEAVPPDMIPYLLFYGLVRHYKGLDVLLRAFAAVARSHDINLVVLGEFWEDEQLYRRLIAQEQLEERVLMRNEFVPDELLQAYIRQAAVVVAPYRQATQSAVIQTAFACGTPVIASAVGGIPDAVLDGQTGLLVPPEDEKLLAEAIRRYLDEQLEKPMKSNLAAGRGLSGWDALTGQIKMLLADRP